MGALGTPLGASSVSRNSISNYLDPVLFFPHENDDVLDIFKERCGVNVFRRGSTQPLNSAYSQRISTVCIHTHDLNYAYNVHELI
jgi:hypothetical protein